MKEFLAFLAVFMWGYFTYPLVIVLRLVRIKHKMDKLIESTMDAKAIVAEQMDEIRKVHQEIEEEWKKNHE